MIYTSPQIGPADLHPHIGFTQLNKLNIYVGPNAEHLCVYVIPQEINTQITFLVDVLL